jgi:large-conductance mechanosensitive channel
LFCTLALPALLNIDDYYSGKEVFTTEEQYTKFKQSLVDSNAKWETKDMQVLSSDPPIIVSYKVGVEKGQAFPYGGFINDRLHFSIFAGVMFLMVMTIIYVSVGFNEDSLFWLFKKTNT